MKLAEIARRLDCELVAPPDSDAAELEISGLAPLARAGAHELTFLGHPKHRALVAECRAGAIILQPTEETPPMPALLSENPYLTFARALALFHEPTLPAPGVHPTAVVDPTATLGANVRLGPYVVVGPDCRLGDDVVIDAHTTLYADVVIGPGCRIHAHVVVREGSRLGARVVLQPGCVIGGDGFGFAPDADGRYIAIPQTGSVTLEDDVEVGANATIDRATMGVTCIGRGTKIDNLVQIGHGCTIGEHTVIAALAGLSGSTHVGHHAKIGGQTGTAGHLRIGDRAVVTGQSGVVSDVPAGEQVSGFPALESRLWKRVCVALAKLPELVQRVRALERERE